MSSAIPPSYLAIDLGASSGRAVLGTLERLPQGCRVATREVHRFRVPLIEQARHLYWDVHALWHEVRTRLGARPVAERTMAITTQLCDVRTGAWSREVIGAAGDDLARWPTIVNPGTVLGPVLRDALPAAARGPGRGPLVVASCSHDT